MSLETKKVHGALRETLEQQVTRLLDTEAPDKLEEQLSVLLGTLRAAKHVSDRLLETEQLLASGGNLAQLTSVREALLEELSRLNASLKNH